MNHRKHQQIVSYIGGGGCTPETSRQLDIQHWLTNLKGVSFKYPFIYRHSGVTMGCDTPICLYETLNCLVSGGVTVVTMDFDYFFIERLGTTFQLSEINFSESIVPIVTPNLTPRVITSTTGLGCHNEILSIVTTVTPYLKGYLKRVNPYNGFDNNMGVVA